MPFAAEEPVRGVFTGSVHRDARNMMGRIFCITAWALALAFASTSAPALPGAPSAAGEAAAAGEATPPVPAPAAPAAPVAEDLFTVEFVVADGRFALGQCAVQLTETSAKSAKL